MIETLLRFLLITDLHFGFDKNSFKILTDFFNKLYKEEKFDAVLVTGDLACNQQKQLYTALRELRNCFPDKEIYTIFGNHDYWVHWKDYRHKFGNSWANVIGKQNQHLHENNIYHLQRTGPIKHGNVWLAGYDGWYNRLDPPTNDESMMPEYINGDTAHRHFNKASHKALERIIYSDIDFYNEKSICLTHHSFIGIGGGNQDFSQNYKNLEALYSRGFNVVCYGHSHKRFEGQVNNMRIYCAGGGYKKTGVGLYTNVPEYFIIEI